jgi:general secretion pathway protein C
MVTPARLQGAPTPGQADLILLGTAIGSFRDSFALIQRAGSKEERVFRLGDKVFDLGELVAVHKESAELVVGGERVKILVPSASLSAPSTPAQSPGMVSGTPQSAPSGTFVVDQRALNAALDNIGQTMTDARLLPSQKEGKVEGFRVSEVRPGGVFAMVGVRNGDMLVRVNDFPVDSPEKAIQSFASLRGQNRIKLDLIRDGQPATFSYDIR